MSKFPSGTVEKNSSTIRSSPQESNLRACATLAYRFDSCRRTLWLMNFSQLQVPGRNFDLCIISTRTKSHLPFRNSPHGVKSYKIIMIYLVDNAIHFSYNRHLRMMLTSSDSSNHLRPLRDVGGLFT